MVRKSSTADRVPASAASVLLVGEPSASLSRKKALLEASGFDITLADNICYAEVSAESQHFDAAIYDDSLPAHEQVSLAKTMRIRWPWMRLVACGPSAAEGLFDAKEFSEAELAERLRRLLA